ncbi:MAG: MBL fold metallo-hydrolase [Gammaproteobacteria bacterium]
MMNGPALFDPRPVAAGTTQIGAWMPIPGFGVLPVNTYVIQSAEPVLVDTGLAACRDEFMAHLRQTLDPTELRWIWITHADADHVGNLEAVLAEAPNARVVTTFLGMAKMGLQGIALDRVHLLNPGQQLHVGDRLLRAVSPPTYDAPETTGLFDPSTRTLFSADSFGALLEAPVESASEVAASALRDGCIGWATIDAPWLSLVGSSELATALDPIRQLKPATILSSHLPPAQGLNDTLFGHLDAARSAPRFAGPDQKAFAQMIAAA